MWTCRLDVPEISRQYQRTESFDEPGSALLTGPVVAYKVYADDGRIEAVQGLAFDELSIRTPRATSRITDRSAARGLSRSVFGP